jgi:hypothetical protein
MEGARVQEALVHEVVVKVVEQEDLGKEGVMGLVVLALE